MPIPSPTASRNRLFFINTIANVLGRFWTKLLALLIIPWLFRYLGRDHWAVYGMGLTVMFLAALADPGLRFGYVKVFSEFIAKGRGADVRRLLGSCFLFYAAFSAVCLGVAWLAIEPILSLAGVVPEVRGEARFLFMAFLVYLAIRETFSVFYYFLLAQQRMSLANFLTVPGDVFHYGGLAIVILNDWGLRGVGFVFIASATFQGLIYLASLPGALARVPGGHPPTALPSLLKYLFVFGWRLKIGVGCDTLVLHADKVFVAQFIGFQSAGLYQLGSSLALALRDFVRILISALLPVATILAVEGDRAKIREVNRLTSRWFFTLISPAYMFLAAMAPAIVVVWVGQRIDQAALALGLLSVAFYVNTAFSASMEIGAGCHLPQLQMRASILAAGANLLLSFALVLTLGFTGILIASVVSHGLGSFYYLRQITRALDDDLFDLLRRIFLKPFAAALLPAVPLLVWNALGLLDGFGVLRQFRALESLVWLGLIFLAYLLVYFLLLLLFRHLTKTDWLFLKATWNKSPAKGESE